VVFDMDAGIIDLECMVKEVNKSSNTRENIIDTSIKHANDLEIDYEKQ
jgi:hypothetical protein